MLVFKVNINKGFNAYNVMHVNFPNIYFHLFLFAVNGTNDLAGEANSTWYMVSGCKIVCYIKCYIYINKIRRNVDRIVDYGLVFMKHNVDRNALSTV